MHYTHMDDVRIDASGQLLEAMDAKRVLQRVPEPAPTVQ
jgi:hypothetical protein